MANKFFYWLVLAIALVSCQGQIATDSSSAEVFGNDAEQAIQVGSIANNPKKPTNLILFPAFDQWVFDMPLTLNTLGEQAFKEHDLNIDFEFEGAPAFLANAALNNTRLVRLQMQKLQAFGSFVGNTLVETGFEISDQLQTVQLSLPKNLAQNNTWTTRIDQGSFLMENADPSAIRMYLAINSPEETTISTYVFQQNDQGAPTKGIFAIVNDHDLTETPDANHSGQRRLLSLAYDFSNPALAKIVVRADTYVENLKHYIAQQTYFECDRLSEVCVGQNLLIMTESPIRIFTEVSVRYAWTKNASDVCVSLVDYNNGVEHVSQGIILDLAANVKKAGVCTVPEPSWGGHVFEEADLIVRPEDSTPFGGTAMEYYLDGTDLSGWNTLTLDTVDAWLTDYKY